MSGMPAVRVARLTRVFPSARRHTQPVAAVVDVTFALSHNEVLGIVGPNGAGKSTLIDLLATALAPSAGSIQIGGVEATVRPALIRPLIGYVPAGGRSLYPRLTALENLRFFASLHGGCDGEGQAMAEAALRRCGADAVAGTRVDRLSDGFVARVTIARALLHDPAILLLDEPARSIDPVSRPSVLRTIRDFANRPGKAAIIVTHDMNDVFEICDRVAVMREGRLTRIDDVAPGAGRAAIAATLEGQAP